MIHPTLAVRGQLVVQSWAISVFPLAFGSEFGHKIRVPLRIPAAENLFQILLGMQTAERERDDLADCLKNTQTERESFAQLAEELQAELDAVTQAAAVERDSLNGAISSASDDNAALMQKLKQAHAQIEELESGLRCVSRHTGQIKPACASLSHKLA